MIWLGYQFQYIVVWTEHMSPKLGMSEELPLLF